MKVLIISLLYFLNLLIFTLDMLVIRPNIFFSSPEPKAHLVSL